MSLALKKSPIRSFGRYLSKNTPNPSENSTGPLFACLEDSRGVLKLVGREVYFFLQGLISNDAWKLDMENPKSMYAAKLNPKGRVQQDILLYSTPGSSKDLSLFIECDGTQTDELRKMLLRYRLRAAVEIEDVSADFRVWTLFGDGLRAQGFPRDPRLHELGARFVRPRSWLPNTNSPSDVQHPLGINTAGIFDELYDLGATSDYRYWRIKHGVGEGQTEIPGGVALPLEHNMDALNGISFKKGCYVGQELTARTHYQGVIRKRLWPVQIEGDPPEVGEDVFSQLEGKSVGKIRAVEKDRALASLRMDPAIKATEEGAEPLLIESTGTKLRPYVPGWWPSAWVKVWKPQEGTPS